MNELPTIDRDVALRAAAALRRIMASGRCETDEDVALLFRIEEPELYEAMEGPLAMTELARIAEEVMAEQAKPQA
jgi:hypothetical protein